MAMQYLVWSYLHYNTIGNVSLFCYKKFFRADVIIIPHCIVSWFNRFYLHKCGVDVITCHVFPGTLTLIEMRTAVWGVRTKWFNLGIALGLPMETLEVIEGHVVFQYSQINDVPNFLSGGYIFNP